MVLMSCPKFGLGVTGFLGGGAGVPTCCCVSPGV